jgi:phage terminase large subunit GpA-like protein
LKAWATPKPQSPGDSQKAPSRRRLSGTSNGQKKTSASPRASRCRDPTAPEKFAYFTEPLEKLEPSDPCREVTLKGSAQIGKTVVAMIFTGASLDLDPWQLHVRPPDAG